MEKLDRSVERIARRAVWSEADGERVAAAWRRSGVTIAEFARRYGLPAHRLYYWRDRAGGRSEEVRSERTAAATASALRFHPVRLLSERADGAQGDVVRPTGDGEAGGIEIRVIRIPHGLVAGELPAMLAALLRP